VLVVVEHGDVHHLAEAAFDPEALRGGDVFEVDATEGRLHRADRLDHPVGVVSVEFDVEHVDVGEALEEDALTLHHRLRRLGTDVTCFPGTADPSETTPTRFPFAV